MVPGVFKIALRLRDRRVSSVTISENLERFQHFNLETDFLENEILFQKPGVPFFS